MTKKLVYKILSLEHIDYDEWVDKCHRDYFWKYEDGSLSAPLTMEERRAIPSDDDDDDAEERQWAQYNRAHDR